MTQLLQIVTLFALALPLTTSNFSSAPDLIVENRNRSVWEEPVCEGDPLTFPWMQTLISNLTATHCDSCLTINTARWNDMDVIEVNWNAGECGISDSGFWTVYSCTGDTIQHCQFTIVGQTCMPVPILLTPENLSMRDTIWRCEVSECEITNDSILCQSGLIDTIIAHQELCDAVCIEGNAGNFVYRHEINGKTFIEFRTTCGDVERNFFDCSGNLIFKCSFFGFSGSGLCDTSVIPGTSEGELLWDCSMPIKGTTSTEAEWSKEIQIFPTLFEDQLTIKAGNFNDWKLVVTNLAGAMQSQIEATENQILLTTADWPTGPYFITIKIDGQQMVRKVMKVQK